MVIKIMANPMLGDRHRNSKNLSLYDFIVQVRGLSPDTRRHTFDLFSQSNRLVQAVLEKQGTFLSEYLAFQRHYEETGEVDEAVKRDLVSCVGEFDHQNDYVLTKTIALADLGLLVQDYSARKKKLPNMNRRTFIKAIAGAGTLGLCYFLDTTTQENEDKSVLDRIKFLDKQYDDLR